jgi:hypothetical protein
VSALPSNDCMSSLAEWGIRDRFWNNIRFLTIGMCFFAATILTGWMTAGVGGSIADVLILCEVEIGVFSLR